MLEVAGGILIAAWVLSWLNEPRLSKEEKRQIKANIKALHDKMEYWDSLKSHPNYSETASLNDNIRNCK